MKLLAFIYLLAMIHFLTTNLTVKIIKACCFLKRKRQEYANLSHYVFISCSQVATALDVHGFSKGDAIAVNMPMTIWAVIIYLGIVLSGRVVVSIADSFAASEIKTRLTISKAKGIFTQVCFHTNSWSTNF